MKAMIGKKGFAINFSSLGKPQKIKYPFRISRPDRLWKPIRSLGVDYLLGVALIRWVWYIAQNFNFTMIITRGINMKKVLYLALLMWGLSSTVAFALCYLTVEATPPDSRIRIMDIDPIYRPGIPITCEAHEIMVEKSGYIPYREWQHFDPPADHYSLKVVLEKTNQSVYQDVKTSMFEHKEKTLAALDAIFKNRNVAYLDKISTSRFQRTRWYKTLKNYAGSFKLNLNHTSETATQEFLINGSERHTLVIDFDLLKEPNRWYIVDAREKKGNREYPLSERGFRPNEYELNFSELLSNIRSGQIWAFYGLAPHGKLNSSFLKGKTLSLSREKSIKIKDIIIHGPPNGIQYVIYLTLTYYPAGYRESQGGYKSGWLLDGGESMKTLYKKGENLHIDIMFQRDLYLDAPNEGLTFFNLKELDSSSRRSPSTASNAESRATQKNRYESENNDLLH